MKVPRDIFDDACDDIPDNRPFKCTQPGCKYIGGKNLNSLKKHQLAHFGPDLQCAFCSYKTKYKAVLKCHFNTHTGEMPYFCEACGDSFRAPNALKRHVATRHHSPNDTVLKCPTCDFTSYWKRDIVEHMAIHGQSQFYCETCKLYFQGPAKLQRHNGSIKHLKAVHKMNQANPGLVNPAVLNVEPKISKETTLPHLPLPCGPSSRTIVRAMAASIPERWKKLQRRIRRHKPLKSKTFKCQICTFKTDDVWSFTAHLRRLM